MANAPQAKNAKPDDLVKLWRKRVKELRDQCEVAEAEHNYTAVATLTRQVTQAEVALLEAKAAAAAERERLSSTGDALERIVAIVRKMPIGAREQLRAKLDEIWKG